jgi:hypothetical protein
VLSVIGLVAVDSAHNIELNYYYCYVVVKNRNGNIKVRRKMNKIYQKARKGPTHS